MKSEIDKVKKQLSALRSKEMKLEAEHFKKLLVPLLKDAIGRTFVYRNNSYGGGRGETWDEFRKVLAVSFGEYHAHVIYKQCALRWNGSAEIATTSDLISHSTKSFPRPDNNWTACEPEEYEAALLAVMEALDSPVRLVANLAKG